MKNFLIAVAIMAVVGGVTAFVVMPEKKEVKPKAVEVSHPTEKVSDFLRSRGFVRIKNSADQAEAKQHWKNKYGLDFISDAEIQGVLAKGDFIMAPAERFTGEIPDASANEMMNHFTAIKNELWSHQIDDGDRYTHDVQYIKGGDLIKEVSRTITGAVASEYLTADALYNLNISPDKELEIVPLEFAGGDMPFTPIQSSAIMVIAPLEKFDLGGGINASMDGRIVVINPDPMVVVDVEGGYVVLAKW